ncbi:prolyl oligopeptidase family serine peptidase [Streptomyces sp. ISL-66]|uniref:prolyl oligopeptidase family serine peptidase n=1 Tax=Streptomyces sp. ISL-66 TaxID=2819186 RepID=UPI001BE8944E|nr:prolyl oligopeptidase family serine peptidase [Streptomyces sp. ISL-66]MBT2471531.1 prolyl oligopeptidase family serine peptidase [Streptomyces sp. ISL-66]
MEAEATASQPLPAPVPVRMPDHGGGDPPTLLTVHGCWYPSADPTGERVAFICDRAGVPQLWSGPARGDEAHVLDGGPDPVIEVSWSPDGRWIAYTSAPGGGEHTRVLVVRPDGTGRRVLAGAEPGGSAHLGCWTRDGAALAVTVAQASGAGAEHTGAGHLLPDTVDGAPGAGAAPEPAWAERDGPAALLGGAAASPADRQRAVASPADRHRAVASPIDRHRAVAQRAHVPAPGPAHRGPAMGLPTVPDLTTVPDLGTVPDLTTVPGLGAVPDLGTVRSGGLAAYLIDPDGADAPAFLFAEEGAASLRVCDVSPQGRLALVRRGPRGRREALVLDTTSGRIAFALHVADGDPWIGRFSADARTLWLRSDAEREFAALLRVRLDEDGVCQDLSVAAEREASALDLLSVPDHGRWAHLAWNVHGAVELEGVGLPDAQDADGAVGPHHRPVLPHEVVTRISPAGGGGAFVALSGSRRRPGIWELADGFAPLRTGWSARDEDAAPPGRPPVRPVPLRCRSRDGLLLGGWYYRAPDHDAGRPAPCVIHLHGGPEEQERPVFNPLYHELLGRGLDVFAPDVRGSSGWGRSFVDADLGAGRFAAIDDVADCAAHVVELGYADPLRLGVMGRSYGGYLTMASLVWHPDLFRAGVAVCGMSDFASFFAGTEPWIAQSAAAKYGHPEHDRDLLRALSPMSRADQLRAPVLTVHGEHDTNVPPTESEQFVRAARERGVPAEQLTLRNEGHDFLRADNRRLYRRAAADWLERHLGAIAPPWESS